MDLHIGEINSTVRATDSEALLSPEMMQQILDEVMIRLREQQEMAQRVDQEEEIINSSSDQMRSWDR